VLLTLELAHSWPLQAFFFFFFIDFSSACALTLPWCGLASKQSRTFYWYFRCMRSSSPEWDGPTGVMRLDYSFKLPTRLRIYLALFLSLLPLFSSPFVSFADSGIEVDFPLESE